jgi:hypothetical protein
MCICILDDVDSCAEMDLLHGEQPDAQFHRPTRVPRGGLARTARRVTVLPGLPGFHGVGWQGQPGALPCSSYGGPIACQPLPKGTILHTNTNPHIFCGRKLRGPSGRLVGDTTAKGQDALFTPINLGRLVWQPGRGGGVGGGGVLFRVELATPYPPLSFYAHQCGPSCMAAWGRIK